MFIRSDARSIPAPLPVCEDNSGHAPSQSRLALALCPVSTRTLPSPRGKTAVFHSSSVAGIRSALDARTPRKLGRSAYDSREGSRTRPTGTAYDRLSVERSRSCGPPIGSVSRGHQSNSTFKIWNCSNQISAFSLTGRFTPAASRARTASRCQTQRKFPVRSMASPPNHAPRNPPT